MAVRSRRPTCGPRCCARWRRAPRRDGAGRSTRSAGARAYAAGSAKEVAGIVVPDDSTVVLTLEEPLNVFPKLLAMPVAAIVPTPTPAQLRSASHRERTLEVRLLVAR